MSNTSFPPYHEGMMSTPNLLYRIIMGTNDQPEATNKTLLKVLSKLVHDEHDTWTGRLPLALWAYKTSKRGPTQATHFSLVYGAEAVLPIEILVSSARMALASLLTPEQTWIGDLEALDDKKDHASKNLQVYQSRISRAYNKLVRPKNIVEGDYVLKAADHIRRGLYAPKFTPKWEGSYLVKEVNDSGYCRLFCPVKGTLLAPINVKYVKKFHS